MPTSDPVKRQAIYRRYYASKGKARRAERYRESLEQAKHINPQPLLNAVALWR
jgi:hypothetical protein